LEKINKISILRVTANMKNLQFKYLVLILGLFLALPGLSQTYNSRYMTTRDGVASGYIRQIFQDDRGFIWVATPNGLSKYDGYSFTNYRHDPDDSLSISGTYVWEVQPAGPGQLFVVSNGGVNLFDPAREVFEKVKLPEGVPDFDDGASDIDLTAEGDAWVTARRGLYFIPKPNSGPDRNIEFYPYYLDTARQSILPALAIDEKRGIIWIQIDNQLRQFNLAKKSFAPLQNLTATVKKIIESQIWELHLTKDGSLLAPALEGFLEWKPGADTPVIIDRFDDYILGPKEQPAFQAIWEDVDGKLYISTGRSGGLVWDRDQDNVTQFLTSAEQSGTIAANDVHFFFKDMDNNYWFGHHERGLSLLFSNAWDYTYVKLFPDKSNGDPLNQITDILDLGNGQRLFSSAGGIIMQQEGGPPKVYPLTEESNTEYYELIAAGEKVIVSKAINISGELQPDQLLIFDPASGTYVELSVPDSLQVISYMFDRPDRVIFGTMTGRVVAVNKTDFSWETYDTDKIPGGHIPQSRIATVLDADSEDNWIVMAFEFTNADSFFEFYLFDKETKALQKLEVTNPGIPTQIGRPTLSHLEKGVMYSTSGVGIIRQDIFENQINILFSEYSGVLLEGSRFILEDKKGFLWMNNASGLMRLDPETGAVTFYEWSGSERVSQLSSGRLAENGEILWMGQGGFVRFHPDSLEKFNPVSQVYVSDVSAAGNIYPTLYERKELTFGSTENNLSFSCLALNYQDPLVTQYRYRILGYDETWLDIGTQRRVYVANMPPGKYEFQLQAAGRNGGFSETLGSVQFEILPPWWQTWWAYAGYALLLVFGASGLHQFQKSRTIRREREKTREKELAQAREIEKAYNELKTTQQQLIHSEKMASLGELTAGIAHEIQNPLNFVNNFSDVNTELVSELKAALKKGDLKEAEEVADDISENEKKIVHHGKRAEEIVKSMLQHSRGTEGKKELTNLNTLADEYLRLAFHGMRAKDKSFNSEMETDLDNNLGEVNVVPQDIGRVLLNLITNAFHALHQRKQAERDGYQPKVTLQTLRKNDKVEIRVKDNGAGIPEAIRSKIFEPFFSTKGTGKGTGLGLSLSYDIITKGHNGQIRVESQEGEGTEFIVALPIN
jgi:signal transduction histidine kinase